ncbi:scavenger receptor cysteine-rich domain-containing protein DMBT1-like [Narcine bancroftii]|uniref:scavenger receptor cysteine-rich domain-containing protein DMBT1-like n=1 Tax=Narcine bancroftii TaxID=1343680 RepID=UPI0038314B8C
MSLLILMRLLIWNYHLLNCLADRSESEGLRLVNGGSPCAGRVEVYYRGVWGTVDDLGWDLNDAAVVCRETNCGAALQALGFSHFGSGTGPIVTWNVNCNGNETALRDCTSGPWNLYFSAKDNDAGVICSESVVLRLVNWSSPCTGRVEVYHQGVWGTVDDKGWDLDEAAVVCREIGCGTALQAPGDSYFGSGTGPMVTWSVNCTGNETSLRNCTLESLNLYKYSQNHNAGVICSERVVLRLANGGSPCAGRVEVYHQGIWGTVGAFGWDLDDAAVVCRETGCGTALRTFVYFHFRPGTGPMVTWSVICTGKETALRDCTSVPWDLHRFSHGYDAGVICSERVELRLVNGSSPCTGRVEVYHQGVWGTVYDEGWDLDDAAVVCRQISCGAALRALGYSHFGPGTGPIVTRSVNCTGNETALQDCTSDPWNLYKYSHNHDAGVICSESVTLRLVNGGSPCAGRVEVSHQGVWGTLAHNGWGLDDAAVVCREMGCGTALLSLSYSFFGPGTGHIVAWNVNCTGNETALRDCPSIPWKLYRYSHDNDASVICSESVVWRMVNGGSSCAGRVEVHLRGFWFSVVSFDWDLEDASVVCSEVGCGAALQAPGNSHFGPGTGRTMKWDVECIGNETVLRDCKSSSWNINAAGVFPEAGVICSEHRIPRLVSGDDTCSGRLDVMFGDKWYTMCNNHWDIRDANVVCRQLQCGIAVSVRSGADLGERIKPIRSDIFECKGDESTLWACPFSSGTRQCNHKTGVDVICSEGGNGHKADSNRLNSNLPQNQRYASCKDITRRLMDRDWWVERTDALELLKCHTLASGGPFVTPTSA